MQARVDKRPTCWGGERKPICWQDTTHQVKVARMDILATIPPRCLPHVNFLGRVLRGPAPPMRRRGRAKA